MNLFKTLDNDNDDEIINYSNHQYCIYTVHKS